VKRVVPKSITQGCKLSNNLVINKVLVLPLTASSALFILVQLLLSLHIHSIFIQVTLSLQNTKVVVVDTDQIKGQPNKSLITSPATPRTVRAATEVEKGIVQAN
jgi:hypothetical protein